jgi:hypothetical protein
MKLMRRRPNSKGKDSMALGIAAPSLRMAWMAPPMWTADCSWRAVDAAELISSGVSAAGDLALVYETQGVRKIETADGVAIEIEQGDARSFAALRASSPSDLALIGEALSGAIGDGRANKLDARVRRFGANSRTASICG